MEFTLTFLRLFLNDLQYAAPLLGFLLLLISVLGYLIGHLEGWSAFDALYHAFINATTVGYGDFRPSRKASKALAILLALVGLIFTGMVVAIALHAANVAFTRVSPVADVSHQALPSGAAVLTTPVPGPSAGKNRPSRRPVEEIGAPAS